MFDLSLLPIIGPAIIWMILCFFVLAIGLALKDGWVRLQKLHQIPCSKCVFYTGDYRLKCTVHPCLALSEEALDCRDYEQIINLKQIQRVKSYPKNKLL